MENPLIIITIGFPIENIENSQKNKNPWVFKWTFRLEQCVGSDGSLSTITKNHKSTRISIVLKGFAPEIGLRNVRVWVNLPNTRDVVCQANPFGYSTSHWKSWYSVSWPTPMHTKTNLRRETFQDHENSCWFMLFRPRTDITITPDTLFEAKGPFEDSPIFKFLRIFDIFYRKSYSNGNQWIFNRKTKVVQENLVKHFLAIPTLLPEVRGKSLPLKS